MAIPPVEPLRLATLRARWREVFPDDDFAPTAPYRMAPTADETVATELATATPTNDGNVDEPGAGGSGHVEADEAAERHRATCTALLREVLAPYGEMLDTERLSNTNVAELELELFEDIGLPVTIRLPRQASRRLSFAGFCSLVASFFASPELARACMDRALRLLVAEEDMKAARNRKARALLEVLVHEDHEARSMFLLGYMSRHGIGGRERLHHVAFELFVRSRALGCCAADYYVALCTLQGLGTERDVRTAHGLFRDAFRAIAAPAAAGDWHAQFILGSCYQFGYGCEVDTARAIEWYQQAADEGHCIAQFNLAYHFEHSTTVPFERVLHYYRLASEREFASAQCNLGRFYLVGRRTPQSLDMAWCLFRMSARLGLPVSQYYLGILACHAETTNSHHQQNGTGTAANNQHQNQQQNQTGVHGSTTHSFYNGTGTAAANSNNNNNNNNNGSSSGGGDDEVTTYAGLSEWETYMWSAASQGYSPAIAVLEEIYSKLGNGGALKLAALRRAAANAGDSNSKLVVALECERQRDYAQAIEWYQRIDRNKGDRRYNVRAARIQLERIFQGTCEPPACLLACLLACA